MIAGSKGFDAVPDLSQGKLGQVPRSGPNHENKKQNKQKQRKKKEMVILHSKNGIKAHTFQGLQPL